MENKLIVFLAILAILLIPACQAAQPVGISEGINVRWVGGNLYYYTPAGVQVAEFDGVNNLTTLSNVAVTGSLNGIVVPRGHLWYVDNTTGTITGDGTSWATATLTINEAYTLASAGDTIYIKGTGFNEAVSCSKIGVSFIGMGSTTAQALWTAPTDNVCLTITAADCVVKNIRFRPPAQSANVPAAISLSGAWQCIIEGNRFQGKSNSWYAILTDGNNANVRVINNDFDYLNTATNGTAIKGTGYTVGENSGWLIDGNRFGSNTNHIVCRFRQSVIENNTFAAIGYTAANTMAAPTTCIDDSGSAYGANLVTKNTLGTPYTTALYHSATNDCWVGNYTYSSVTAASGLSTTVPGGT